MKKSGRSGFLTGVRSARCASEHPGGNPAALLRLLISLIGNGSYSGLLMGEKREGLLVHLTVDAYHDNGIFEVWIARIHR